MGDPWRNTGTASPVAVGQFVAKEGGGFNFFRDGTNYSKPNSLVPPSVGVPALALDFGFGQGSLVLDFGGFYAAGPSSAPPEEP